MLRLTISREEAGNALAASTLVALREALDVAARSDEVRVVALIGAGKNFCTGVEQAEANAPKQTEGQGPPRPRAGHIQRRINLGAHGLVRAFSELQLPVVVGVRGWAAGLGNSLALLSDYIIASETAKFWTPFVGLHPGQRATASVGLAKAMLQRHLDADLGQALAEEGLMEEASLRSADFKEGTASRRERRPSRFEGR